jgi:hypothetical protein
MRWTKALAGIAIVTMGGTSAARASIEISSAPTSNVTCSAGVCTPTSKKAVLNAGDLATMLAASDVKVTTGGGAVTITVAASFSWTSASRLTLDAAQNVSFTAPVSVAGPGALSIVYNDGGTGGDLVFFPGAKVDFWDLSSSLTINGNAYTLVGSIVTLAADVAQTPSGYYALAGDYDASSDTAWPIPSFSGTFEGLGHQISNMTLSDAPSGSGRRAPSAFGLFAVASGAFIRDLNLEHVVFSQRALKKESYGAVAGTFTGDIDHVSADADLAIVGKGCNVGGLVGSIGPGGGYLRNSSTTGSVSGCFAAGGLVGISYAAISGSSSSAAVTGSLAGGLTGLNGGSIEDSHASGTIKGGQAGGLAGESYCSQFVDGSYATGDVTGKIVGGLVGYNTSGISNSYAMGAVHSSGKYFGGGLVGMAADEPNCGRSSVISYSYSTSGMTGHGIVGGVIGKDSTANHVNKDAYWDLDTSGVSNPSQGAGNIADDPGLTGLTDAQLKSGLPAGFDPSLWGSKRSISNGYPYLLANPPQ